MKSVFVILLFGGYISSAIGTQTCIAPGKFVADYSCTSYIACLDLGDGSTDYPSYTVNCPTGFYVRMFDMICLKTEAVCDPTYTCTGLGNFPNPSSTSASSYISCIQGIGTMIVASVMTCPDSQFNSELRTCEQIITPSDTSTSLSTSTTNTETVAGTVETSSVSVTSSVSEISSVSITPSVSETSSVSVTPAVVVEPMSLGTSEIIPNIFTTTTQKIGTHRVNSASHIYSRHVIVLTAVISVIFNIQH